MPQHKRPSDAHIALLDILTYTSSLAALPRVLPAKEPLSGLAHGSTRDSRASREPPLAQSGTLSVHLQHSSPTIRHPACGPIQQIDLAAPKGRHGVWGRTKSELGISDHTGGAVATRRPLASTGRRPKNRPSSLFSQAPQSSIRQGKGSEWAAPQGGSRGRWINRAKGFFALGELPS